MRATHVSALAQRLEIDTGNASSWADSFEKTVAMYRAVGNSSGNFGKLGSDLGGLGLFTGSLVATSAFARVKLVYQTPGTTSFLEQATVFFWKRAHLFPNRRVFGKSRDAFSEKTELFSEKDARFS